MTPAPTETPAPEAQQPTAVEQAPVEAQTPPAETPAAQPQRPQPTPAVQPQPEGPSLISRLGDFWWVLVVLGLGIIASMMGTASQRRPLTVKNTMPARQAR